MTAQDKLTVRESLANNRSRERLLQPLLQPFLQPLPRLTLLARQCLVEIFDERQADIVTYRPDVNLVILVIDSSCKCRTALQRIHLLSSKFETKEMHYCNEQKTRTVTTTRLVDGKMKVIKNERK